MMKFIIASASVVILSFPAIAGPKGDALRSCQVAWQANKAKPDYTPAPKGQGRQAYWTFIKECQSKMLPAAPATKPTKSDA